jgi:hypothetical protein
MSLRVSLASLAVVLGMATACSRHRSPAGLGHDAYVWQRLWPTELGQAVTDAPSDIRVLHVLAREWGGTPRASTDTLVDVRALASSGREVVAVIRIEGTSPLDGVTVDDLIALASAWRERGVRVTGIEIDHDCPTARLPAYLDWLMRARPGLRGLSLGITALPTWLESPMLARLTAAVDEVVVQVHTIAAPVLFDAGTARRQLEAWGRATGRGFRVALPTYRARLKDGGWLAAEPRVLARFVAELRERPIPGLGGVVWFRLGHRADANAWSLPTLTAVVRGSPLAPRIVPRLVADASGAWDVVLENTGSVDSAAPARLAFIGDLEVLDGVQGFSAQGRMLAAPAPPRLRAGDALVVGFVRGKGIDVFLP